MQPKNFVKIRHLYLSPNFAPVKLCLHFHLFILEEQIRWRNDENLCFASISSLEIYWLWCWFTEIEVRWEQSMLSFSFFIFFLPHAWKQFKLKEFFCSHRKKVFFVGRKPEITTLTSYASEVKKCCFFPTQEILSISFLFKSCYKSLSIFPPITNQCSLRIWH